MQYRFSVDKNVLYTGGILVRLDEGGVVLNRIWIEHHHVGKKALFEAPAPVQTQVVGGQSRQFTDGFLQRDDLLFAHIFRQDPGKAAVSPRMRIALEKNPFRCE